MRNSMNPYGGVNPLIDKMIGNAYDIVKYVARYLKEIRYVAENMESVYIAANGSRTVISGTATGTGTLTIAMPEGIDYDSITSVDVAAYSGDGSTIRFPGASTFTYVVTAGNLVITVIGATPDIALATYRATITHTETATD